MATLEQFLKTGQLGPLYLGIPSDEVIRHLGVPPEGSPSAKPLVFKYGDLELTFWKQSRTAPFQLTLLSIYPKRSGEDLPDLVRPTDLDLRNGVSEAGFRKFIHEIHYPIVHVRVQEFNSVFDFASNIRVFFAAGELFSLHLSTKDVDSTSTLPIKDEREPSVEQIEKMFDEATYLADMPMCRAGMVVAWAGFEATMRRLMLQSGKDAKIGMPPTKLMRELRTLGQLTDKEAEFLEHSRQLRTAIVHGLAPEEIHPSMIRALSGLGRRLLDQTAALPLE